LTTRAISRKAFSFSYFPDKKAVFFEALQIYLDRFNTIFQEHMAGVYRENLDKRDFLKGFIGSLLQAHHVFIDFHNELTVMYYSDPEIRELTETLK
jgi:AcrR family transcriptional regulator